jgi:hypothetical protein
VNSIDYSAVRKSPLFDGQNMVWPDIMLGTDKVISPHLKAAS